MEESREGWEFQGAWGWVGGVGGGGGLHRFQAAGGMPTHRRQLLDAFQRLFLLDVPHNIRFLSGFLLLLGHVPLLLPAGDHAGTQAGWCERPGKLLAPTGGGGGWGSVPGS